MAKKYTIISHKSLFFRLMADYVPRSIVLPARVSREYVASNAIRAGSTVLRCTTKFVFRQ